MICYCHINKCVLFFYFQVIINNNKDIVFLKSGFLGHFNDASTYRELPSIGPGMDLDFPANLRIIADSIYPCRYPLITPYKSASIARQPPHQQHRMRKINLTLRSRRVYVEHVIKEIKTFRVIGGIYRHKRHFLAHITELCAGLSQRKAEFLERYT
ncbi:MAG: transposase family protein [Sedimenticola sp.]